MEDCKNCGCPSYFHGQDQERVRLGDNCNASVDNNAYCKCKGYSPKIGNPIKRPSWDEYFLKIAEDVAQRATCHRATVGCVVVAPDHSILVTGYNGVPAGEPHCPDDESLDPDVHCERSLHAEVNARMYARIRRLNLRGATWYVWYHSYVVPWYEGPCPNCEQVIANTYPAKVVMGHD